MVGVGLLTIRLEKRQLCPCGMGSCGRGDFPVYIADNNSIQVPATKS